ncbi:GntR family transcriptional regulator [Streptomyces sp. SID3212]|uniref:substrate-binding domain-containing protein n=1 Tax=Streptomyces sp. SID3212 TaxID=2690259 RepID=UPI0013699E39|nr:GntR family transcriptional regulator [Streptomyces sp. SID3212]MYV53673.1 substrate-binding domain-containing protein [Streptomyces sp. SID3212]
MSSSEGLGTGPRGNKTQRLADDLRRAVAELRWPAGKLPTEQQLARDQAVSVNTVRRAVDLLVQEGLVYRRQGSGTYVRASPAPGTGYAIGVVVPSLTYYYPRVITGIERELSRHGCRMILRCAEWNPELEREAVEELTRSGSDGLIVVPTLGEDAPHPWLRDAERSAVPMVLVERGMELPATSHEFVCSHHAAGARAAVEHLLRLGHTRIGYAERTSPHTAPQVRSGLATALEQAGLDPVPVVATSLRSWTAQDADRFLDQLVRQRGTAALCFADREASLLVGAARRRGLRVPEDLSVIGYDNEVADLCEVPLTAVAPAKTDIGRRAAHLIRTRIADPGGPRRQEILVPELVARDSTAPPSPNPGSG